MREKHQIKARKHIIIITIIFFAVGGLGLFFGGKYINSKLLIANENMAEDIAGLVVNNFHITDEEVTYMKSLSFNEMEVDPINMRLMDIGNGIKLNTTINNVFVIAPLDENEIKYTVDDKNAEFFGYEPGTKLDGIWLLNGKIDEKGKFEVSEREDIYRYTQLTEIQKKGIKDRKLLGEYSSDAWGEFITGYAPLYTVEGSYVGMVGIDMNPDKYQNSAKSMIYVLSIVFAIVSLVTVILFVVFYIKYMGAKTGQLYFNFYSRMSHDMRTPMNGILGMARISEDEKDINVLHDNIRQIEESGQYMLGLINDTLDIQKMDAGKLKLDPKVRYCKDLIDNLQNMIRVDAQKKNIDFVVENKNLNLDVYGRVDELRIQQIFMNLASNAVKFTPEGGKITLILEGLGVDGNISHNRYQIIDTGIGMSQEFVDSHLFHAFEQEQDSVTTQYGGSGLGLSIVKSLVELMKGRIQVETQKGVGTAFIINMDMEIVPREEALLILGKQQEEGRRNSFTGKGKKVLLCEDNQLNAKIAEKLLIKKEFEVTIASNGQEGIDIFSGSQEDTFDVILMDIRMPIVDGIEASRIIRKLKRIDAKKIPIIAMTANTYDDDIKQCMEAGMNAHIAKPVNPEVMYETIAKYVNR